MQFGRIAVGLSVLSLLISAPASARLWNPTPQQLAQEYSSIAHNKGGTAGRVVIQWIASPAFTGNVQTLLDRYIVVVMSHSTIAPGGLQQFEDMGGVQVTDAAGQALTEIPRGEAPPVLIGMLAGLEANLSQTTQGKGKSKIMIFQPGTVRACDKGGLAVLYAGEKYTFETPMPGCTPK